MTAQELLLHVGKSIGLDSSGAVNATEQTFLLDWLNEALQQFLLETKVKVESQTVNLTVGYNDYELPSDVLVVNQVEVTTTDGQVIPLAPIDPEEMLWRRRYPGAIPIRYYSMQGANLLMLYPTPTESDIVTMYYVPYPTAVTSSNWTSDIQTLAGIPSQFHHIVEYWVLFRAGDFSDDASSQNGMSYFQLWQLEVKKARGKIRRIQGRKRPFARAGRRQRLKYYPAFPSQDTGA